MRWAVVAGLVMAGGMARAQPGVTTTQPDPEAPLPRSGPAYVAFGVGANFLSASWHDQGHDEDLHRQGGDLCAHLAVGPAIAERLALFVDGQVCLPVAPPFQAVSFVAVGGGATFFLQRDGNWHLDLAIRKAWAGASTNATVGADPPRVTSFGSWVVELGVGRVRRSERIDRGWTVSLLGGLLRAPRLSDGWMAGASAGYAWSLM
jgi:hypothetical protein